MHQLGGAAIYLFTRDSQLGRGEPVEDAAQVISRMCDVIMVRTFEQDIIERFAANSRVPVINGLTNEYHPCQILADVYTFIEHRGPIKGKTVAWIGDSNNVCNTWLQAAEIFDFKLNVSTPPGYEIEAERTIEALRIVRRPDGRRAKGAHLVTTDVWTSMGFESENEERKRDFQDWHGRRRDDEGGEEGRALHALPARAPRRGSRRRGDRRHAERGLGRSREPAAHTEGVARISLAREGRSETNDKIKKVVLAYSGGLDTLGHPQVAAGRRTAARWSPSPPTSARARSSSPRGARREAAGVKQNIFIEDLREEFVRDFVLPDVPRQRRLRGRIPARHLDRAAADRQAPGRDRAQDRRRRDLARRHRQGQRPGALRARRLRARCRTSGSSRRGASGTCCRARSCSRTREQHGIPVDFKKKKGGAPYSMDANLLHISYEGGILEDPAYEPEESMWRITVSPEKAPDRPEYVELGYRQRRHRCGQRQEADAGKGADAKLNRAGRPARHRPPRHGREPLRRHEDRAAATRRPAARSCCKAHRAIESITLDREVLALKDDLDAALRAHDLQRLLVQPGAPAAAGADRRVAGDRSTARCASSSTRARCWSVGRASKTDSLFDPSIATFEDDKGAYNQADAAGFIRLNALRMRIAAREGANKAACVCIALPCFASPAWAAPFALQVGDLRLGLDAAGRLRRLPLLTGSPRLIELAESLTAASNRILVFALTDADMRRFNGGDAPELRQRLLVVTPRALEHQRTSGRRVRRQRARDAALARQTSRPKATSPEVPRDAPARQRRRASASCAGSRRSWLSCAAFACRPSRRPVQLLQAVAVRRSRAPPCSCCAANRCSSPSSPATRAKADLEWIRATTLRWIDELRRLNASR